MLAPTTRGKGDERAVLVPKAKRQNDVGERCAVSMEKLLAFDHAAFARWEQRGSLIILLLVCHDLFVGFEI